MKKIFIIAFAAIVSTAFSASAQIQKGNVLVGGNFANLSLGLDDSKVFSLDLTPKAAWFIEDNIALGAYANLGIQTAKNSSTTTNYGVGALGRYYTGEDVEILKHGRFFGEATLGLGGVNVSDNGGHTNGVDLGVGPGFAYFITPNIGLETLLKYNGVAGFGNAAYQSTLNLSFGLQVYLPGKSTVRKIQNDMK
ncbi:MAG: hypothetical protein ACXVJD_07195 [Mucilaginibacter sp.]